MSTVGIVPEEEAQRKPSESRVEQMLVSFWSFLSFLVVFIRISKNNYFNNYLCVKSSYKMSVSLRPVLKYVSLALSFALVLGTVFIVPLHLEVFVGADDNLDMQGYPYYHLLHGLITRVNPTSY